MKWHWDKGFYVKDKWRLPMLDAAEIWESLNKKVNKDGTLFVAENTHRHRIRQENEEK